MKIYTFILLSGKMRLSRLFDIQREFDAQKAIGTPSVSAETSI